jgi:flagellar hook-basal body complex protein FliE
MTAIPPISGLGASKAVQPTALPNAKLDAGTKTSGPNLFESFLETTNLDQKNSDQAVKDLIEGKTDSVQEVVMAVAKAEMSFQLFMEIRNHLIDSYTELMRMQF